MMLVRSDSVKDWVKLFCTVYGTAERQGKCLELARSSRLKQINSSKLRK